MGIYWFVAAELIGGLSLILIGLSVFLSISGKDKRGSVSVTSLPVDDGLHHTHRIAASFLEKEKRAAWPLPRLRKDYGRILSAYQEMNDDAAVNKDVSAPAEWLLDNFYAVESQYKVLLTELRRSEYRLMPVLRSGPYKGCARVFAVAVELLSNSSGLPFTDQAVASYFTAYQEKNVLAEREVRMLPVVIRLVNIGNIRQLCDDMLAERTSRKEADRLFDEYLKDGSEELLHFKESLMARMAADASVDCALVDHLCYRLRISEKNSVEALGDVYEALHIAGTNADEVTKQAHNAQSLTAVAMESCIQRLHYFASLDWSQLLSVASRVDRILRTDSDRLYAQMDQATRELYRTKVEEIAFACRCAEVHVAREAVSLAARAIELGGLDAVRKGHVGYYLLDDGKNLLAERLNGPKVLTYVNSMRARKAVYGASIGLAAGLIVWVCVQLAFYGFAQASERWIWAIIAGLAALLPATQIAVTLVHSTICHTLKPALLPKMELKDGIPAALSTVVVIPAVISDEKGVDEILGSMEEHYLRNREENLYFAVLGAFGDANRAHLPDDQRIIDTAMTGMKALNQKYGKGAERFYYFHRERKLNASNGAWIGWERKRGAIMEFNELLQGGQKTSFVYASSSKPLFEDVKYVITLDCDTVLPIGMAKNLIRTMAHPLNQPLIDRKKGIVTKGYGLIQARVEMDVESAEQTFFSRVLTDQNGIDPYAGAISDVYQDMFAEGSFTGKGIYDLNVFRAVLDQTIPENAVLSHDLLEGSYLRTGLATDLTLVDDFPSGYGAYAARQYRWIRGDWQLLPFLFSHVRNQSGERIVNPLPGLARWKMFDNLRRSLNAPTYLLLFLLGIVIRPVYAGIWIACLLGCLWLPFIGGVVDNLWRFLISAGRTKRYHAGMGEINSLVLRSLLEIAFLPYQAWLCARAILVTLVRLLITKRHMLEWVTSAQADRGRVKTVGGYVRKMQAGIWAAACCAGFIWGTGFDILMLLPFVVLWGVSPLLAYAISIEPAYRSAFTDADRLELRRIARKTWRYFEEFAGEQSHYLAVDNYQQDPFKGAANRTSPTNIGLGLLAVLTARDMQYIDTPEMLNRLERTIETIEILPKWEGHLYNWYDTETLKPLRPAYVSTVDSGNLAAYLMTLEQGLNEYLKEPIVGLGFLEGLLDTLACAEDEDAALFEPVIRLAQDTLKSHDASELPLRLHSMLGEMAGALKQDHADPNIWIAKTRRMLRLKTEELNLFFPATALLWSMPRKLSEFAGHYPDSPIGDFTRFLVQNPAWGSIDAWYQGAKERLEALLCCGEGQYENLAEDEHEWLKQIKVSVEDAHRASFSARTRYENLILRVHALASGMRFAPLYDAKKKLFRIGYNVEAERYSNAYYDLLASEARLCSYVGIASGEIPAEHWFRMGRSLTVVGQHKGLVSWSGTMFEYLMPLLVLRGYSNTLLDETYAFAVRSQIQYGKHKNMPWGMSESAYNVLDKSNDYQYKAIGVPWIGLKRGLVEDAVVAPYATMLALAVSPTEAMKNIASLKAEGLEGAYGYYEAADYTPDRLYYDSRRVVIKSYMAHHQGMSLLAINNALHGNLMQKRFQSNPQIRAYRRLLQEKVPANIVITKDIKEKARPASVKIVREAPPVRVIRGVEHTPAQVQILTNGNYSVMLTNAGTGYSRDKVSAITRWREDAALDSFGTFFYLRDVVSGHIWSATFAPLNREPVRYQATFTEDKAVYARAGDEVDTQTEVFVASGDKAEIRRITLKNKSRIDKCIEITSYMEVVLAPRKADLAHRAFSNLFVETGYDSTNRMLTARRRKRDRAEKEAWLGIFMVRGDQNDDEVQFETDRMLFLGRGNSVKRPEAILSCKPLSRTVGSVLDPIMSLRTRLTVRPDKTACVSFVTIKAESLDALLFIKRHYSTPDDMQAAAILSFARSRVETRYARFQTADRLLFEHMLSHILFLSPLRRRNENEIKANVLGQPALWRFGVSGDLPILLVKLSSENQIGLLYEALKAHEYWNLMDVHVDLVVILEEARSYTNPLLRRALDCIEGYKRYDTVGGIFALSGDDLKEEEVVLLTACARICVEGGNGSLSAQMAELEPAQRPPVRKTVREARVYSGHSSIEQGVLYFNGLGGFGPDGKEYILRIGKEDTPAPWMNVIANPCFGFTVSELGSGYTWYENSHEYRLTPWSNDPVSDPPGESLYLCDVESGKCFSPTRLPIRIQEEYGVKHGIGYSSFTHTCLGIEQTLVQFVPVEDPVKVSLLTLENKTDQYRRLSATYYIRPVLGVSDQDTALHIKSSVTEAGVLILENAYAEMNPKKLCFMDASEQNKSFTGDRNAFFGLGGAEAPECLLRECLSGTIGAGLDPCGAIQISVDLAPDERKAVVFLLGIASNIADIETLTHRYGNEQGARAALETVRAWWADTLGIVRVKTPDEAMNLLLNSWLPYQVITCRLWARTGLYQSGGAFGFRDQLQDVLAIAANRPQLARDQILKHACRQYTQGDVQHWWHEPQGKGVRTRCSDDLLWLPYVTAHYVKTTGDADILMQMRPFVKSEQLTEEEVQRYESPAVTDEESTLYDHCLRAIDRSLQWGEHGLPLMQDGDWNDGMNAVGCKGRGESVWLGWFLASVLEAFAPCCRLMKDDERAQRCDRIRKELLASIERSAWDGDWYLRAYFDDGRPLGSIRNEDCKIDSIAQSWAVLANGNPARARRAMQSVEDYLVNRKEGLIKLLTPPFDLDTAEPGYIKGYVPGIRENGGQYTHAAVWAVMAIAKLGEGEKALELFDLLNPILHTSDYRGYMQYKTEPYVMAADVYAVSPNIGRGGWTWYTGAAGWMYRAGLESILGIQKEGGTLYVAPCVPSHWQDYAVEYRFMDTHYHIQYRNPGMLKTGSLRIWLDGTVASRRIPLVNDKKSHRVEIQVGRWNDQL